MTIERFLEVLTLVKKIESETSLQTTIEGIAGNLTNLVNSPGQPAQQAALASGLEALRKGVDRVSTRLTPSDVEVLDAMAGSEFFSPDLAEMVSSWVSSNAMTPSVARDSVQKLSTRRSDFLDTVEITIKGLTALNVKASTLSPGTADVSFLIPRNMFDNELESFSKELKFISKIFGDYSEAITGDREAVKLETLSSSVPTIVLIAALPVLSALGDVVNKFLTAWKTVEEIREVRSRVAALGIKGAAYNEFTKQITTTIDGVINEAVAVVIEKYDRDSGRKNELAAALRTDTKRLFGQIEQGLEIRFRAAPAGDDTNDAHAELQLLSTLGREMKFPIPSEQPLLLSPGEVIEDGQESTVDSVAPAKKASAKTPKKADVPRADN